MALSTHDALSYLMVVTASSDSQLSDAELTRIYDLIGRLPVFSGYSREDFVRAANRCADRLNAAGGLEAVLAEANDSDYGLAASLWTNNLKVGLDLAHRLEAGLVQINQNLVVQANLSYGGVKSSGLGKEASLEAMLEHFTHKKTIMVNMA